MIQSDRTYHESGNHPGSLNRSAEHLPKHFPVIRRRKNGLYFTVFIREESEELFDMMLEQAQIYKDKRVQTATDEKYGEGFSAFLSDAIAKFYE